MTIRSQKSAKKSTEIESDDLILEILLTLPSESIRRFITASKHWNSLINNPTFIKLWRNRNLKPSTGLVVRTWSPLCSHDSFVAFSPSANKPTFPQFKIKQSCNGLLLCSTSTKFHVINPTTNMSFTLPKLVIKPDARIRSLSLAFDPMKTSSYKVVGCVGETNCLHELDVHVYSSDTREWKTLSKPFIGYVNKKGVYWNGAIHWGYGLSYFDIENEIFKKMPRPPGIGDWRVNSYFGESFGHLDYAKVCKGASEDSCSVRVYELKRDYSDWDLKCSVDLGSRYYATQVLSVVHGAEESDSFFVLKAGKEIVRYNLVSKISEELPCVLEGVYIKSAFQYIESQWGCLRCC